MDGFSLSLALAVVGAFAFVRLRSQPRSTKIIKAPTTAFVDLSAGGEFSGLLEEDRAVLAPLFSSIVEETAGTMRCDVLFLYCNVELDGRLQGSCQGLRELIRDSGAIVVVIASENHGSQYVAASRKTGYGTANLVMTTNRKGAAFTKFFHQLFSAMKEGKSMPLAWVALAPQIPGHEHPNCPESIFACEAGPVAFL